ncbi:HYR domain-containing protein [Metabacillus sediminilitoris]|nr:HYR domain-containing protein [Metabacillus sediminilitoris]
MPLSNNCSETISDTQSALCGAITNTLTAPQIICSNETFVINLITLINVACGPGFAGGFTIDQIFAQILTGNATFTGNVVPGEIPPSDVFLADPPNIIQISYDDAIFEVGPGESIVRTFDPFVGIEVVASATIIEEPIIIELSVTGQSFLDTGCTCGPNFDGYIINHSLELLLVPSTHPCCTPTITCPDDITVFNDSGTSGAFVNFQEPIVSDNSPGVTAVCTPESGSFFPPGTTTVTCTATDASGNISTCSFNVRVIVDPCRFFSGRCRRRRG